MINFQNLSNIGNRCTDVDSALQLTLELIFIEICAMNCCFTGVCIWSSIQNQAFTNWVTCMQTELRVHKNWFTVLIFLYRNTLNLPMCSSFLFYPVLGCFLLSYNVLPYLLPRCSVLIFLFVCFFESRFCSINHTSLSQSRGWFPFILNFFYQSENYLIGWFSI